MVMAVGTLTAVDFCYCSYSACVIYYVGEQMIKVENVDVWGFEHAIRGMRNPLNSWTKSDSHHEYTPSKEGGIDYELVFAIGEADLDLMRRLYKAGTEHRKYLRQVFVNMDVTAPLYWWKEFDTYKVGTVANSCSTMHTIHSKEFELDDFSHEHMLGSYSVMNEVIKCLNHNRAAYLETKDKSFWWQMIQLLPSSYNQRRTITMNYENVVNIIRQRTGHKLDEWNTFVEELKKLPYIEEIINAD